MKLTFLSVAILFSTAVFSQTKYSQETLEKIKQVENNITGNFLLNDDRPGTIAERMEKYHVNGMSIAVIYNYKIAWAKGYGWADEAEKRPVTIQTLFEPGSISKCLNSIGVLKLAQENKVDLYTDINTYLTSWKFPYDSLSNGKKITLADILSHNAGLTVHGFPGHDINGPIPSVLQVLDGIKPSFTPAVRSMYEPGLKYEYSGGGITISQVIITDITRQAYDVWMYENVLKPIGMINSSYAQPPPKDKQPFCASAYNSDGSPISNKFHVYPEQAAAGLWMTPSDLCNYIIDMQLAYQGKQPSKVLNPEMVKLHLTRYKNGPSSMGSFIQDHDGAKFFTHSAGNDGFCGDYIASLEDGNGVVIFLNTDNFKLIPEVINSIAKAYNWKNFYREPKRKKTVEIPDSLLETYEGIYLYENLWAGIVKKDSQYYFHARDMDVKMYFSTPTSFFNKEFTDEKEFIKDDKGNILGYSRTVDGKEFPKARKITNPDTIRLESNMFDDIGWYLFETKKYGESKDYYRRGVDIYPQDPRLLMNLAHVYLYSNEYDKAMAIYTAHIKDTVSPGNSWEDQMQADLIYFKEHGYNIEVFDKVFAELKIKKPPGY